MVTPTETKISWVSATFAIAVGISLPGIFLGRSVLGIALVAALLAYVCMPGRKTAVAHLEMTKNHSFFVLIVVVLISWVPQMFESIDPWKSLTTIARSVLFVVGAVTLWSGMYENRNVQHLALKTFLASAAILMTFTIIALTIIPELYAIMHAKGWVRLDVIGGFKGEAAAGAVMIPLALWAGWYLAGWWRWAGCFVAIAFLFVVMLTNNRAGVAGLIGALIVIAAVAVPLLKNRLSYVIVVLGIVGTVVVSLSWVMYSRIYHAAPPEGSHGFISTNLIDWHRQEIWRHAWSLGDNARWFGKGVDVVNMLPGANATINNSTASALPLHPHNWAIETIVETGFIGFSTLLVAIAYSFSRFIRDFWRYNEWCVLAVICVWVVYWTSGLFNFSYWSAWWQVLFYVATAMCLSGKSPRTDNGLSKVP